MNFEPHAVSVLLFEYCPSFMLYAITDDVTQCILFKCGVCPIVYFAVNFTVTSVGSANYA